MKLLARALASVLALVSILGLGGCKSIPRPDGSVVGPFHAPKNIRATPSLPHSVARVVVLPVAGPEAVSHETLDAIGAAFHAEFTRAARAELIVLDGVRLQRLAGEPRVRATEPLPDRFLTRLRESSTADAVLFLEVTSYRAYPPLALGIRGRLVTTDTQETLWACDELFDASLAAVRNSARRHAASPAPQPGSPGDLTYTVLQNPDRFAAYVAAVLLRTLPAR
jgi:hypothetical protein